MAGGGVAVGAGGAVVGVGGTGVADGGAVAVGAGGDVGDGVGTGAAHAAVSRITSAAGSRVLRGKISSDGSGSPWTLTQPLAR